MKSSLAALGVIAALGLSACASDPSSDGDAASGDLTVDATDSRCTVSATDLEAGPSTHVVDGVAELPRLLGLPS